MTDIVPPASARGHVQVGALDSLTVTRFHWKVVLLGGLGWMFDAMDTIMVSLVLPALVVAWGLTPGQAGLVGTMDRLGALVGAALAGLLADRYGRRLLFQATLLVYSLATGLLALAGNLSQFLAIRFIVGLGLGGELPVVITLASELVPARRRGWLMGILDSFFTYGLILAALIAVLVVPRFGWQAAFLVGALPALFVFFLRRSLPESPRFLAAQGRWGEAQAVLQQAGVEGALPQETAPSPSAGPDQAALGIRTLFTPFYLRRTILVWTIWFCLNFTFYGIFIWLPSLLVARGIGYVRSLEYTLLIDLAQIPGYLLTGYLADRLGRRWTFVGLLLLSTASAALFGLSQSATDALLWGALLAFFNVGAYAIAYTYTPEVYATPVRATGAGWATAFGRVGAAIAPLAVGLLLELIASPSGQTVVFLVMGGFFLLAAAAMAGLAVETRGKSLEALAGAA